MSGHSSRLGLSARGDSWDAPIEAIEADIAARNTSVMRNVSSGLKEELRSQILQAGLGQRLANTWRGNVYPASGKSLDPATLVYSKAPHIILSMTESITIVPVNGAKMLAIPTTNTPNTRGPRGGTVPMTPEQVENHFNQDLIFLRGKKPGVWDAFVNVVAAKNKKGFRRATPGRLAQGRQVELKLMFVCVPNVRTKKIHDLQASADRWAAKVPAMLETA